MDLGFQVVPAGTYIWRIAEGIDLLSKEDSEAQSLKIPLIVDQGIDGDETAVGQNAALFINLITKEGRPNPFGEKQINTLLTITGLVQKFEDRFPENIEPTDSEFVDAFRLKLTDKRVKLTHDIRKGDKGELMNFRKMEEVAGKRTKTGATKPKAESEPANEDW
jgi:hypothetical protein